MGVLERRGIHLVPEQRADRSTVSSILIGREYGQHRRILRSDTFGATLHKSC